MLQATATRVLVWSQLEPTTLRLTDAGRSLVRLSDVGIRCSLGGVQVQQRAARCGHNCGHRAVVWRPARLTCHRMREQPCGSSRRDRCVRALAPTRAKTITTSLRTPARSAEIRVALEAKVRKGTLRVMLSLLVFLGIAFFIIAMCRPRRTLRDRMDTTPTDMRRADDGRGYGNPEDPSTTWAWPTN
jgi:hypothetical protein